MVFFYAKIIVAEINTLRFISKISTKIYMDFLDPRKFKRQKITLMVGYLLIAIAIGLGTIVLVYGAYGYGINTKNGDIVQNGLVFIDSKPGGADIFLNNKSINQTTSARLVLPAKKYDLLIKKTGYRDWERKFTLDEHTISRFVYPFLLPNKPVVASLKNYQSQPPLFTQSPDRHWMLVQIPDPAAKNVTFDEYDAGDFTKPSVPIALPATVLSKTTATVASLTEVEWSSDNNHVLLRHDTPEGNEFIILDRNDPAKSININKSLAINPTEVAFKNKKADQLYIYTQDGGTLQVADMGRPALQEPILKNILAFKPYGSNLISYVTQVNLPAGKAQARIWDNGRNYPLYAFNAGDKYLLDIAAFSGHTFFTAGSSSGGRVNIEGGQNFGVYDIETGDEYQYTLQEPVIAPLRWMDGHRLIGNSNGSVFIMDFDSMNKQTLVASSSNLGGFFSRNYNQMYTLTPVAGSSAVSFERVDMRAGVDLPKTP
jgi:hypothetical protein